MSIKYYRLKRPVAMEPWHMGVPVPDLYVPSKLLLQGHPKKGDMVAFIEGQPPTIITAEEFARYKEVEKERIVAPEEQKEES